LNWIMLSYFTKLISIPITVLVKLFLKWFSILCNISWIWPSLLCSLKSLFYFNMRPAEIFSFLMRPVYSFELETPGLKCSFYYYYTSKFLRLCLSPSVPRISRETHIAIKTSLFKSEQNKLKIVGCQIYRIFK